MGVPHKGLGETSGGRAHPHLLQDGARAKCAGTGGSSTCLLPTSYSVKLSTLGHRGARQKAGKSAESTEEMRRNIAEGTSELDTPGFKTLGK